MSSDLAAPPAWTDCIRAGRGPASSPIRLLLTVATAAQGLLFALTMLLAVLVDQQGDILANRSEARGGFDPSVFPPHSDAIWLLANGSAALSLVILIALTAAILALRSRRPH